MLRSFPSGLSDTTGKYLCIIPSWLHMCCGNNQNLTAKGDVAELAVRGHITPSLPFGSDIMYRKCLCPYAGSPQDTFSSVNSIPFPLCSWVPTYDPFSLWLHPLLFGCFRALQAQPRQPLQSFQPHFLQCLLLSIAPFSLHHQPAAPHRPWCGYVPPCLSPAFLLPRMSLSSLNLSSALKTQVQSLIPRGSSLASSATAKMCNSLL